MRKKHGYSLIEVLICLILLSLILLGFDAAELLAFKEVNKSFYFNVAQEQMISISDRLQTLSRSADLSHYLQDWNQLNAILLPFGKGYVTQKTDGYDLALFWGTKTNKTKCHPMTEGNLYCLSLHVTNLTA